MKHLNLLVIGGRKSGKSTLIARMLYEVSACTPSWLNLKFTIHHVNFADAKELLSPGSQVPITCNVRKKKIFWFSVLMEFFQLFIGKRMTEIGGVQLHIYEMDVSDTGLGQWLMEHPATKTPLGIILVADPFAIGKSCDVVNSPAINIVAERVVERFEQIYVTNPGKRFPVSIALVVTKAESFPQFQTYSRRFVNAATLAASRCALRDADGMYSDSYLLSGLLERQNDEIRAMLENYDGNFVHILQNEFRKVGYFWSGIPSENEKKGDLCRMTSSMLPILSLLADEMEY